MPSTVFDHPIFPGSKIIKKDITVTNVSGAYSETFTDDRISAGMQVNKMYVEDPSVFRSDISVQTLGGSFVFSCSDVVGTTDVTLEFLKIADDPNGITSTEFNVLNNKIGEVPSGTTLQGEIESINENLTSVAGELALTNNWTANGLCNVEKSGNVVTVHVAVRNGIVTANTLIATIPTGFRHNLQNFSYIIPVVTPGGTGILGIDRYGRIYPIVDLPSNGYVFGSIDYCI